MDLVGKYSFANMMKSGIEDTKAVIHSRLDEFKIQEDVKIYNQLPYYDGFRGFRFPGGADLTAISKRIYEGFAKPSRLTLKHFSI